MSVEERDQLLQDSIPEDPERPNSTRYAVRVTDAGLEWYIARAHLTQEDEVEYHGYPIVDPPSKVARRFRDRGSISQQQYQRIAKRH